MGLFKQQQSQRPFTQQRACDACPLRLGSVHATGLEPAAKGAVLPPGSIACQGRSVCWPRHGPANLAVIGFEFRSAWLLRGCRQFWPRAWRSHLAPSPRKTDPCRPSGCRPGGGRCFLIGLAGAEGGGAGLVEVRGGSAVRVAVAWRCPRAGPSARSRFDRGGGRPALGGQGKACKPPPEDGRKIRRTQTFLLASPPEKAESRTPIGGGTFPPPRTFPGLQNPSRMGERRLGRRKRRRKLKIAQ